MEHLRLHRAPHRAPSQIAIMDGIGLRRGRAHEACGPGRHAFALWAAAQTEGPILWIRPSWQTEHMNPDGMCTHLDPGRLIFVACGRAEDLLWCLEESLRSGAVALAVAELPAPPPLTPVRRLHLAAEAGAATGPAPTGLLLLPGDGGAAGIESRWHVAPAHDGGHIAWRIVRRRARQAPPKAWLRDRAGRLTQEPAPA